MPNNETISNVENTSSSVNAKARKAMIDSQLRPNAVEDKWILLAMAEIAREDYVPADFRNLAYMDRSVPLGNGRYLPPALTSALMLQKAAINSDDNLLYIGAASGYNVMVAAQRAANVVALDTNVAMNLSADNVTQIQGQLHLGAPDHAPYDVVIIEGAIEQVPQTIIDQMAEGARLICGLSKGKVSHLCIGYKRGNSLALVAFMECEIEKFTEQVAVGFEKEKEFSF